MISISYVKYFLYFYTTLCGHLGSETSLFIFVWQHFEEFYRYFTVLYRTFIWHCLIVTYDIWYFMDDLFCFPILVIRLYPLFYSIIFYDTTSFFPLSFLFLLFLTYSNYILLYYLNIDWWSYWHDLLLPMELIFLTCILSL